MRTIRSLLTLLLTATLTACGRGAPPPASLPLPVLPKGEIELRVAHVVNPRLPKFSAVQIQQALEAARQGAHEHLGLALRFTAPQEIPVAEWFAGISAEQRARKQAGIADFKSQPVDLPRLAAAYTSAFRQNNESLSDLLRYAAGQLPDPQPRSLEALGQVLAQLHVERAKTWMGLRAPDGQALLDREPYNEIELWVARGYAVTPFELVLTNQPFISVEYNLPAIHSGLRGGYSNGVTTYGQGTRYGSFSLWSSFAYLSTDPWVIERRGGETYTPDEAARLAGLGLLHELGHQLRHYSHPFGIPACVMNPVTNFSYRAWVQSWSAADCAASAHAAMRPGAATLYY